MSIWCRVIAQFMSEMWTRIFMYQNLMYGFSWSMVPLTRWRLLKSKLAKECCFNQLFLHQKTYYRWHSQFIRSTNPRDYGVLPRHFVPVKLLFTHTALSPINYHILVKSSHLSHRPSNPVITELSFGNFRQIYHFHCTRFAPFFLRFGVLFRWFISSVCCGLPPLSERKIWTIMSFIILRNEL